MITCRGRAMLGMLTMTGGRPASRPENPQNTRRSLCESGGSLESKNSPRRLGALRAAGGRWVGDQPSSVQPALLNGPRDAQETNLQVLRAANVGSRGFVSVECGADCARTGTCGVCCVGGQSSWQQARVGSVAAAGSGNLRDSMNQWMLNSQCAEALS